MKKSKRKVCILVAIVMVLCMLPAIQASAADMLLTNYGFESDLTAWTPTNPGSGTITSIL